MPTSFNRPFNTPRPPLEAFSTPTPPSAFTVPPLGTPKVPAPPRGEPGMVLDPVETFPAVGPPAAKPAAEGGGDGGGGGGNALAGFSGAWPTVPDPAGAQSDYVWGYLKGIISGQDLPFGPKEIDIEKGQAKTASETTFQQAKDALQTQGAATGMASSPAFGRQIVDARIGASAQYGKAAADIAINAASANFQARLEALGKAQQWIDGLRSYTAQMTGAWWEKEARMAELDLAQQQLDAQIEQWRLNYAAQYGGG